MRMLKKASQSPPSGVGGTGREEECGFGVDGEVDPELGARNRVVKIMEYGSHYAAHPT